MKWVLAAILAMVVSAPALAEVKVPGTFVPTRCGAQKFKGGPIPLNSIREVCLGYVVGRSQSDVDAVSFRFKYGAAQLFYVQSVKSLGIDVESRVQKLLYVLKGENGMEIVMKASVDETGEFTLLVGRYGALPFFVSDLDPVYTTLGVAKSTSQDTPETAGLKTGGPDLRGLIEKKALN